MKSTDYSNCLKSIVIQRLRHFLSLIDVQPNADQNTSHGRPQEYPVSFHAFLIFRQLPLSHHYFLQSCRSRCLLTGCQRCPREILRCQYILENKTVPSASWEWVLPRTPRLPSMCQDCSLIISNNQLQEKGKVYNI